MNAIYDFFEERIKAGDITTDEAKAVTGRMEALGEIIDDTLGDYSPLDSLVSNGYITKEEANSLQEPLQELPKEKKLLIACYVQYSKAIDYNKGLTGDFLKKIKEVCSNSGLSGIRDDQSIEEYLGAEETAKLYKGVRDALIASITEVVTSFVLEKRRRIRQELKKALLLRMANALSFEPEINEETGNPIDSIPYLRIIAKENGYREKAKSLNDEDRKALSLCADYYLDLLEVLSLNGVGDRRMEEYENLYNAEGYLKETFYYRDIEDEALMEFRDIYDSQSTLYSLALNASPSYKRGLNYKDLARLINSAYCTPEDLVVGRILNTKFREYALDLYRDEQLKEKLSPECLAKWESFLDKQGLRGSLDEAPATPVKKPSAIRKKATPKKKTTTTKKTKKK